MIPSTNSGVYRSEKYVVVERHRHQFPQRCTWCNRAIEEKPATPAAPGTASRVHPPACATCKLTRNRLPMIVAVFGVTTLLAAPALYFTLGPLVAGALLLTGLADLGIAWWLRTTARKFHCVREDEQYVWIGGAHQDFIATLPAWHGMKFSELQNRDA